MIQDAILTGVIAQIQRSGFLAAPANIKILTGSEEGIYAWLANNYFRGSLQAPATHTLTQGNDEKSGVAVCGPGYFNIFTVLSTPPPPP